MNKIISICIVGILLCTTFGASMIPSTVATDEQQNQGKIEFGNIQPTGNVRSVPYTGRLRVYIVEPVSRWNNYAGQPYHFGFLGFALNEAISIDPQDTYHNSITWAGDISESNAMVIAAVFNSESHQGYAYPPSSNPFTAHYTDATAAATPGNTGYNTVTSEFTHTVLVEEATATWCQYCPAMANTLYAIYQSGDYPWYFVALVADMNTQAASRLNEFNTYGYPTAFYDGGYQVNVGGSTSEPVYRTRIVNCGHRAVPDLNLSVSVSYIGSGDLQIEVNITNNDAPNYPPVTPQAPSGDTIGNNGIEYAYTASTTDLNGDNVWYWFDWDDGSNSGWVGPHTSGQTGSASHIWSNPGTYDVKVKAKDTYGDESTWSPSLLVNISAPLIEIGIKGESAKINVTLKNAGAVELTNVNWSISVKGGLFGFIDVQSNGIIDSLAVNEEVSVKTNKGIFGLGKISILVITDQSTKTTTAFVFGPFISIK